MQPVASQAQVLSLRTATRTGDTAHAHREETDVASQITVTVATDDATARQLIPEWRQLRAAHRIDSPDADPEFFLGVYRELGSRVSPHIAVFRNQGSGCALLVARRSEQRLPLRIGSISIRTPRVRCLEIVFDGLITSESGDSRRAIIDHLQSQIDSRSVDLIEIHHLDEKDELLNLIKQQRGWSRVTYSLEGHHVARLLDGTGAAVQRHSSKTRNTFRREDKKLAAQFGGELVLETLTRPEAVDEFIAKAGLINQTSYHRALNVGVADDARWRAIVNALANGGAMRGYVLRGRNQPIAYMLGAVYGQRCTFMATGYRHELQALSPGKVMMNRVLDALANEGVAVADFGWGDASYKTMFASERLNEATIQIYGSSARARIAFAMRRCAAWCSQRAKVLAGAQIVATLRRRWRDRLRQQFKSDQGQGEAL